MKEEDIEAEEDSTILPRKATLIESEAAASLPIHDEKSVHLNEALPGALSDADEKQVVT